MKTTSLIKALNKAQVGVIRLCESNRYEAKGFGHICEWFDQDGSAICVKVRHHNDHDDSMSDYSAGFFPSTIKDAVKWTCEV